MACRVSHCFGGHLDPLGVAGSVLVSGSIERGPGSSSCSKAVVPQVEMSADAGGAGRDHVAAAGAAARPAPGHDHVAAAGAPPAPLRPLEGGHADALPALRAERACLKKRLKKATQEIRNEVRGHKSLRRV